MTAVFAAALQAAGGVKSLQILMVCLLPLLSLLSLQPADSSAAPDVKAWRQTGPRLQLSHSDLRNGSAVFWEGGVSGGYQALLMDEDQGWLLVGGKDHIYLLRSDSLDLSTSTIYWPAAKEHVEHCRLAGKSLETECANFVQLLQPFNKTHVYACGTGAFHPQCTYLHLGHNTEEPVFTLSHAVESGRGKCPFSPREPFTARLTDGELYAGTSVDFMGANAAIFRTSVHGNSQHYIRTEAYDHNWLNEPEFVGSFSIPDTHSPDDDKVYFFFRERAVEAGQWDKRVYSRVARVCKNDVGGKRSLINRWTTFLKARLVCSVPGPSGVDTQFDELEDIFVLETKDPQNPTIYGVFSTSSSIFRGSAVCVYSMASIRAAFNGPFAHKEGPDYRWVEYKGRIPYPRPGTCPSETYDALYKSTKDFPDEVVSFMRQHQLMWEPVMPLSGRPVLTRVNSPYMLKKVVVDRVVQVLASPDTIPQPSVRIIAEKPKEVLYSHQRKYIQCSSQESTEPGYVNIKELAEAMCRYDLDDMDLYWLHALNRELDRMGEEPIDELTMERAMEALESQCHDNMNHAIETVEGLGIEYDEDVICDVCRSPDSEEGNDMVFCDKCNICVHQACYGIVKVPVGNWLCRTCVLSIDPQCLLCPLKGGAMKATRAGTKWAHVSCALWIPEVSIACPERMEPITKVSHIPPSRWSLICSLCKVKTGACIQCSVKNCTTPFHVTCAFEHSLEMKTILDEGDEVKFKSYCLKHSKSKSGEAGLSPARSKPPAESGKVGQRAQRLQELEEEFYTLIQLGELAPALGLSERLADFIYQYWKLKRKANFNKALLPPKEEEENLVLQPQEDSIHTRMRMFMHLRQDLERVRNLCYMVSRREKLKLLQSKAQEQMFNLHVKLLNQEFSAGLPASFPVESMLFRPPPRITLKLKMPKASSLGNGNPKSGNGPLCPDNSGNVTEHAGEGLGQGKPQLHGRNRREERSNGRLSASSHSSSSTLLIKPTGKPLALHAALHGHSSNSNGKLDQAKSNGLIEKFVAQKDSSCQTPTNQDASNEALDKSSFRKSAMEHFGRSFKEATINLVRTTEDLRASDKLSRKGSAKERLWVKPISEHKAKSTRSYQDSDGYCPDLELSDSEPEAKGRHRRQGGLPQPETPRRDCQKGVSRGKQLLGSRHPMQR